MAIRNSCNEKIEGVKLNDDFIKSYNENGYVIIRDIIPKKRINSLLENVFKLYCKYSDDFDSFEGIDYPWQTEIFHKKLIEFRKTNPEDFGAIYDSLKTSLSLTQLASDDQVVENVARLLKTKVSNLSISEPMCRLDVPDDKRNLFDWHQDRSYFPQNRDGLNGLVCWIPLIDITEEMGAIHISPKSHLEGNLNLLQKRKKDSLHSTQTPVPNDLIKKYDDVIVPVKAGDLVLFNMLVFHSSGKNISNKVRLTLQGRFHIATADDFIPFELNNYYNQYIKQKLEEKYDCSDIPNNIRQPPVAQYGG
jgi:ectoine hydroxylase-related dioxygenase (phytanoyl-CoA dioxygenase family)|tara:strand:+ start:1416 stop:2333 length:918 start_codon:yes stop_codon:yes gene_type:complete